MENNSGYRRILTIAPAYRLAQWSIGADRSLKTFTSRYVRCQPSDRVVDIGCGTADIRPFLDIAEYIGIEPNGSYAAAAAEQLNSPDRAIHAGIGDPALDAELPESANIVLFVGVLHHLDDDLAGAALDLAADLTRSGGRCVTIDPTLRPGQRRLSRALVERDRGRNVRSSPELRSLFEPRFRSVTITEHDDLLRVPYDHAIVEASA